MSKIRQIDEFVTVQTFGDGSSLITDDTFGRRDSAAVNSPRLSRKLARALEPLYVVKSDADCYLMPALDRESEDYPGAWTDVRAEAAHFVSKSAAQEAASHWPIANARVVRVVG